MRTHVLLCKMASFKSLRQNKMRHQGCLILFWRREWDSNPRGREPKRFSRPPRYDHFDIPPYSIVTRREQTARGMTAGCDRHSYQARSPSIFDRRCLTSHLTAILFYHRVCALSSIFFNVFNYFLPFIIAYIFYIFIVWIFIDNGNFL